MSVRDTSQLQITATVIKYPPGH